MSPNLPHIAGYLSSWLDKLRDLLTETAYMNLAEGISGGDFLILMCWAALDQLFVSVWDAPSRTVIFDKVNI